MKINPSAQSWRKIMLLVGKADVSGLVWSRKINLITLHKMLWPEKEGGIPQKERRARRQIWDLILTVSFGGKGNIKILEKDRLPYSGRSEHIKRLGHVVLKGHLNKEGKLEAGELFGKFEEYAEAEYLLEMKEGVPQRIFFLSDHSAFEFFPIVDNKTGKIVGVHRGKIRREKLLELGDITTYTYLGRKEGALFLGGGRLRVNGEGREDRRPWAKFANNLSEKVKIVIKEGIVYQCTSLESDLDAKFALVWDKVSKKYITSFWGGMYEDEFNELNDHHEIHGHFLSRDGSLYLGGREWMNFGRNYSYCQVNITEILNPTGRKAFIAKADVLKDGKIVASKRLSIIYAAANKSSVSSFARGDIINVFEKWSKNKLGRQDSSKSETYIISEVFTDETGVLNIGKYWGRFSSYPRAKVEAKMVNDRPAFVRFVADKEGKPILDEKGNPLVIDLRSEWRKKSSRVKHVEDKPVQRLRSKMEPTSLAIAKESLVQEQGKKDLDLTAEIKKDPAAEFINVLENKGATFEWIAQETGIAVNKIKAIQAGKERSSREEFFKIRRAYIGFITGLLKRKKQGS